MGTWNIASFCTGNEPDPCGSAAASFPGDTATLTFKADGYYEASLSVSVAQSMTVPQSCLMASGTSTCDQHATSLDATFGVSGGGPSSRTGSAVPGRISGVRSLASSVRRRTSGAHGLSSA